MSSTAREEVLLAVEELAHARFALARAFEAQAEVWRKLALHVGQRRDADTPWCVSAEHDAVHFALRRELRSVEDNLTAKLNAERRAYDAFEDAVVTAIAST